MNYTLKRRPSRSSSPGNLSPSISQRRVTRYTVYIHKRARTHTRATPPSFKKPQRQCQTPTHAAHSLSPSKTSRATSLSARTSPSSPSYTHSSRSPQSRQQPAATWAYRYYIPAARCRDARLVRTYIYAEESKRYPRCAARWSCWS